MHAMQNRTERKFVEARERNRVSARVDVPPLVPDMDPKKLRLIPLDPEIATTTKYNEEFQKIFGLK
jgi:hypothetical protein